MRRILPVAVAFLICATFLFVLPFDSASAQIPPIGIIDFYGLRSISEQQVREALQIKEGDAVPDSREEAERRLEALPNVEQARLNLVCCEAGKTILYVGIKERGAPTLRFRPAPRGRMRLPDSMIQAGDALSDAVTRGVEKGDVAEDDSQGHALFHNPEARAVQERFITFAAQNLKLLHAVLRESSDAHHRALAAEIIAYTANKRDVVKDLVYGMSDPDEDVRNNSIRALVIIASFARATHNQRIRIPAEPFIEMLNSIIWTDRNKSSGVLLQLTDGRDAAVLSSLRQHALQSLVEMARWKSRGHAGAAFFILGRVGNLSDDEIQKLWDSGNRQLLIETALKRLGAK
jgi:hypothetical protein